MKLKSLGLRISFIIAIMIAVAIIVLIIVVSAKHSVMALESTEHEAKAANAFYPDII